MKRLAVLLMCMVVFGAVFDLYAESGIYRPEKIQQPMLWKVTGNGLEKPSWLLGTIHVGDPRITGAKNKSSNRKTKGHISLIGSSDGVKITTSKEINEAFNKADDVVVEIDLSDLQTMNQVSSLSRLPKNKTLDDVVSPSTVELVKEALAVALKDIPAYADNPEMIDIVYKPLSRFKPIFLACSMNMMPEMMKNKGAAMDILISLRAKQSDKKLHSLETVKQQIDCFDVFSLPEQEKILVATCKEIIGGNVNAETGQLIDAYIRGDVNEVDNIMTGQLEDARKYVNKELLDKFYDSILNKRNDKMAVKVKEFFNDNRDRSFLVAVGFAHMTGDNGLVRQLRDAGYTVTRVKNPIPSKIEQPMLWEITGNGLKKSSWIFGSIDVADPRITGGDSNPEITTSPRVNEAFENADEVVVDIDTSSPDVLREAWKLYFLPEGHTIEDVLSGPTVELVKRTINTLMAKIPYYRAYQGYEDKMYEKLSRYKPMLMMSYIGRMPGTKYANNADPTHKICLNAKKAGKKITGVSTYDQWLARYQSLDKKQQEEYVVGYCNAMLDRDDPCTKLKEAINLYLWGDVSGIRKAGKQNKEEDKKYVSKAVMDKLRESFYDKYSEDIFATAKSMLTNHPDKSVFFSINCGMIIDEKGLIKQLRDAGYTVKRVKAKTYEKKKEAVKKKPAKAA